MKYNSEPATNRIKTLLEVLSMYLFNLYYLKGKDIVFSSSLCRMEGDNSDPHEVISISFTFHPILMEHCNAFSNLLKHTFRVVTRSQAKVVGTPIPKVHGADKATPKT